MPDIATTTNSAETFSYALAGLLVAIGVILSFRQNRLHPLLLACISALSISWIEAPYDWATYAQFPPELPRMPSWWPLNWTWGGGVPRSVPIGYMSYMVFPALIAAGLSTILIRRFRWRRPNTLLTTGLVVGFLWALVCNGFVGARMGVYRYGRVIEGLALSPGTIHQYPLYDALAMGIQMMIYAYLLGRIDSSGRTFVVAWADSKTSTRFGSACLSVLAVVVIGNAFYLSVFAPHYVTKVLHMQTVAPSEQLYPGIPNQPL